MHYQVDVFLLTPMTFRAMKEARARVRNTDLVGQQSTLDAATQAAVTLSSDPGVARVVVTQVTEHSVGVWRNGRKS